MQSFIESDMPVSKMPVRLTTMFFGPTGVYLPNAKLRRFQILNAPSGNNEFGTPPSGKRWLVLGMRAYNMSGSSLTIYVQLKNGGTYYQASTVIGNISNNTFGYLGSGSSAGVTGTTLQGLPVFEASDTFSCHTSGSGFDLDAHIMEFDTASNLKTIKTLAFSTGNNTLYTCPTGKSAVVLQQATPTSGGALAIFGSACGTLYANFSGATRTIYWNSVVNGGSVVAPNTSGSNAISLSTSVNASAISSSLSSNSTAGCLNSGDFINLNTDAGTATQYAWVTVIEQGPF